jgi:hypothetical protein
MLARLIVVNSGHVLHPPLLRPRRGFGPTPVATRLTSAASHMRCDCLRHCPSGHALGSPGAPSSRQISESFREVSAAFSGRFVARPPLRLPARSPVAAARAPLHAAAGSRRALRARPRAGVRGRRMLSSVCVAAHG